MNSLRICERALEILRYYDELEHACSYVSLLAETRSKPKPTAKIFSAGSETIKATVIFVRNKPRQPACRQGAVKS